MCQSVQQMTNSGGTDVSGLCYEGRQWSPPISLKLCYLTKKLLSGSGISSHYPTLLAVPHLDRWHFFKLPVLTTTWSRPSFTRRLNSLKLFEHSCTKSRLYLIDPMCCSPGHWQQSFPTSHHRRPSEYHPRWKDNHLEWCRYPWRLEAYGTWTCSRHFTG